MSGECNLRMAIIIIDSQCPVLLEELNCTSTVCTPVPTTPTPSVRGATWSPTSAPTPSPTGTPSFVPTPTPTLATATPTEQPYTYSDCFVRNTVWEWVGGGVATFYADNTCANN